ncbi:hypothetical protein AUJ14_03220 [Candidatus Micrarchaeota archaeon CG1_02_55_22]|nr:MAG: hypothetical protein AUJ14_03220 [Candidatus Micrarchaeota archaeon CG1_02_55_22]
MGALDQAIDSVSKTIDSFFEKFESGRNCLDLAKKTNNRAESFSRKDPAYHFVLAYARKHCIVRIENDEERENVIKMQVNHSAQKIALLRGLLEKEARPIFRAMDDNEFNAILNLAIVETEETKFKEKMNKIDSSNKDLKKIYANFLQYYSANSIWHIQQLREWLKSRGIKKGKDDDIDTKIREELAEAIHDIEIQEFKDKLGKEAIDIDALNGHEFEDYIASLLKEQGYDIISINRGHDHGGDIIIQRFGNKIAVQTKRMNKPVGNAAVKDAISARMHYSCDDAWVITNAQFTTEAIKLAKSGKIRLISGSELKEMA